MKETTQVNIEELHKELGGIMEQIYAHDNEGQKVLCIGFIASFVGSLMPANWDDDERSEVAADVAKHLWESIVGVVHLAHKHQDEQHIRAMARVFQQRLDENPDLDELMIATAPVDDDGTITIAGEGSKVEREVVRRGHVEEDVREIFRRLREKAGVPCGCQMFA